MAGYGNRGVAIEKSGVANGDGGTENGRDEGGGYEKKEENAKNAAFD